MLGIIEIEVRTMALSAQIDVRSTARHIVEKLPAEATWDDLIYKLVECREIEAGLADVEAGRTLPVEDVMREFGVE